MASMCATAMATVVFRQRRQSALEGGPLGFKVILVFMCPEMVSDRCRQATKAHIAPQVCVLRYLVDSRAHMTCDSVLQVEQPAEVGQIVRELAIAPRCVSPLLLLSVLMLFPKSLIEARGGGFWS